ncbi:SDS hydrolase SdsA1 [Spirochaetia bacterium]|nr:SDS hydrolase SdsA1 [Spirochaetia bacterium]GHU30109.1 SDS hydrolase SdsA1 [Spirochaetia bacterium]
MDFDDRQEFEFAEKGLIAAPDALEIFNANGDVIWSQKAFAFVEDADAPGSANPSLWRNTQLNHAYGLFEVMDGIYQVRGYDLSNITFIKGEEGWIVFDPLSNIETAKAALDLINKELGMRPVTGVVISHSHGDHFGGIKGVVEEADVQSGKVSVIAPEGFEEHAVSENVYAGNAMLRRADYMYGKNLEPSAVGRLGVGLGVGMPGGMASYISPSVTISKTGEELTVDGVKMVFQLTPGTEALAEMNTWFPTKKALWMAENCTGTLHNLYTLRGAQVRDGNAWAFYIMESLKLYGNEAEVVFQAHNWPHWGKDLIPAYFTNTAAMYKFINDQTLLYINQGYTSDEISNMLTLPDDLEKVWYTRQYYGTVAHDAKAVYQRYMGWYDANPVNLNPLTPSESAKKLVEYMGDANKVLAMAKKDFDKGEYQWVVEVTNAIVFANPKNENARLLCADALEQLGYQAESGVWRAAYLTGAKELREGAPTSGISSTRSGDMVRAMSPTMLFDYIGIHLDSNAAQDLNMVMNVNVAGDGEYCLTVKSGVLLYQRGTQAKSPDVTVSVPKQAIALLLTSDALNNELVQVEGNKSLLEILYANMIDFDPYFNIVEP